VVALFRQNELLNVADGDEAEVYLKTHPGHIIKCTVDSVLWATAQGQMPISGNLPNTAPAAAPEQRIAVRLRVAERDRGLFLAAGARGSGAIFTQHGKILHVIRKVMLRVSTKLDWLVLKVH
jgi:multidrug resistance efflux pump